MSYNFFYDEAEHSRKINDTTVKAENYCDNFMTVIVGWTDMQYIDFEEKYIRFESKYLGKDKNFGELKSGRFKKKNLTYGFASIPDREIEFYEDFLSLFDEDTMVFIFTFSKIEYLIKQLFSDIRLPIDNQSLRHIIYSIVKTINSYRPEEVIHSVCNENANLFIDKLCNFYNKQIFRDLNNIKLKSREIQMYATLECILPYLKINNVKTIDWSYTDSFVEFKQMLNQRKIRDYHLFIDREGRNSNTLKSALFIGLTNVEEKDSKECLGIRVSDMLAGLTSKLMKQLHLSLRLDNTDKTPKKKLLEKDWFILDDRRLNLYKKLYTLISVENNKVNNCAAGIYSDDLVAFVTLLDFMNQFERADDIKKLDYFMLQECFNSYVLESLKRKFGE